ncbi:MAG TPA: NAD(P)H-binding protein [Kofleriaceae bacterium]
MKRVVVLGGTGSLGSAVAAELTGSGYDVVVASRRGPTKVDVTTGEGLTAAMTGAEVVVDATNTLAGARDVLVDGTARVLAAARDAGIKHFVGISIVGIDDAPIAYYRTKVEQEKVITNGPVPWTLLRATQFHDLIPKLAVKRLGMIIAPRGMKLQPIDVREVAEVLAVAAASPPAGRVPDVGGPEVIELADLVRRWQRASGATGLVLRLPLPTPTGAFLRSGKLCAMQRGVGTRTFDQWLAERYPRA